MYTESYLKYLLGDDVSLRQYYEFCQSVKLEDIKRNLMLAERENNRFIPDHYYRLGQEQSFRDIKYFSHLFTIGLRRLTDNYLEVRGEILYVKAEMMNSWQMLLPYMPPLLLDCIKLWTEFVLDEGEELDYIDTYFRPNFAFTTYPCPYIPQLEDYLEKGGFTDLHMHLNGTLETDLVWQDFLQNPLEIKTELEKSFSQEKVKEQYTQSTTQNHPDKLFRLFKVAGVLRDLLFCYAYHRELPDGLKYNSFESLLTSIAQNPQPVFSTCHPMETLLGKGIQRHFMEGILYIRLLQVMSISPQNETISHLFHYYLLILGLVNKMLVQQPTDFGFEEFQKITLNGLREYSESRDYYIRFIQLSGNQLRYLRRLEGRFSPKDSQEENEKLLGNIQEGWEKLCLLQKKKNQSELVLRLVAHFIKKKDDGSCDFIRYRNLRLDIEHRAELLTLLFHGKTPLSKAVVGIDAAASELDAPPEVFAQVYHRLRKAGFQHFTYHAGEDFFHILSGLRAIYEAIIYLDLQRCDRIGHATAAGVPVALWHRNVGDRMLIRRGEHLDNLIFAYHLITRSRNTELKSFLPSISLRIDELGYEVYRHYHPSSMHVNAWKMRKEDPQMFFEDMERQNEDAVKLYQRYHSRAVSRRYNEIIEIDSYDVLGEEQLTCLQLLLLEEMHRREIVIETLPTSNVMIGNYHDYNTYHLYDWYRWKKQGKSLPPIVVGTDDSGIFATNIYNEFCHIFCQFVYGKGMNVDETMAFIRELDENARMYAFGRK